MRKLLIVMNVALVVAAAGVLVKYGLTASSSTPKTQGSAAQASSAQDFDRLLAPIALYPDQLLAQMLLCAGDVPKVVSLNDWIKNQTVKGTELQDAAVAAGFGPSFVALALFPQVVDMMAADIVWTGKVGQAFTTNRAAVFDSIQRLRGQAQKSGALKTTPQQTVETQTTASGQEAIVIEPANPQVVYVPQYNPQVVYTQPTSTTVVVQEDHSSDAAVAGVIGFTAGIAIGAAVNNSYYYGPYGWHGGAYMYNDAWNDYYDAREDAREDWQDHREDMGEQRTDRAENRQENRPESQAQREQRRSDAQTAAQNTQRGQQRQANTQTASTQARSSGASSYEARGYSRSQDTATSQQRTGTKSDAFSGYSSGRSERAASARGGQSRGGSRGGGGRRR